MSEESLHNTSTAGSDADAAEPSSPAEQSLDEQIMNALADLESLLEEADPFGDLEEIASESREVADAAERALSDEPPAPIDVDDMQDSDFVPTDATDDEAYEQSAQDVGEMAAKVQEKIEPVHDEEAVDGVDGVKSPGSEPEVEADSEAEPEMEADSEAEPGVAASLETPVSADARGDGDADAVEQEAEEIAEVTEVSSEADAPEVEAEEADAEAENLDTVDLDALEASHHPSEDDPEGTLDAAIAEMDRTKQEAARGDVDEADESVAALLDEVQQSLSEEGLGEDASADEDDGFTDEDFAAPEADDTESDSLHESVLEDAYSSDDDAELSSDAVDADEAGSEVEATSTNSDTEEIGAAPADAKAKPSGDDASDLNAADPEMEPAAKAEATPDEAQASEEADGAACGIGPSGESSVDTSVDVGSLLSAVLGVCVSIGRKAVPVLKPVARSVGPLMFKLCGLVSGPIMTRIPANARMAASVVAGFTALNAMIVWLLVLLLR